MNLSMKLRGLGWAVAALLAFTAPAVHAATYYVRAGATGANNGSDWSNAWSRTANINQSLLQPGDTVYIAAGTYGPLNILRSGAAGKPLVFKRATAAEHGTATGWTSGMDGQVVIDGGRALAAIGIGEGGSYTGQNFVTIDGATRYGIRVINAMFGVRAVRGMSNNLTIRNLEIGDAGASKMGEDGIQGLGNNLLVEDSYIHDNDNITTHGDGIQWYQGNSVTLRYNVFANNGQMMMLTETVWGNQHVNDLRVYYNVFRNRGGAHYNGISKKLCPQSGYSWYVYNNTFDLQAPSSGWQDELFSGAGSCSAMKFVNNAVINSRAGSLGGVTHSSNAFDNSSTYAVKGIPSESNQVLAADLGFVDVEAANYRLKSTSPLIGRGVNVGLTRDFDGRAVGAAPTIGAFEPSSASTAAPRPPSNLVVR